MAEGPRDALVSRNSATYKTFHLKTTGCANKKQSPKKKLCISAMEVLI